MKLTDKNLVYYGPHPCQKCDLKGKKGTMIVKAGNGAPDDLEFDFKSTGEIFTNSTDYPNGKKGLKIKWKKHKHLK